MNRAIWEGVAEAKDVCKAKSLDMDVADLRLQNLQYEKNHFSSCCLLYLLSPPQLV